MRRRRIDTGLPPVVPLPDLPGASPPGRLQGLARRLRKSVGVDGSTEAGVVLVTSRHRLWQRYGPEGVFAFERAVGGLVDAMAARGLCGTLAYIDDSPLLTRLGVLPADAGDAAAAARVVRQLSERLSWTGPAARYVLLLGDDGLMPQHRLPNPAPEDGDEVISDQPYAADADDPLRAVRSVGRIPDAGLEPFLGAIRHAAAAHEGLAEGAEFPLEGRSFGYSASIWKRSARDVFATLGEPRGLRLSPPLSHRERPEPGQGGPRFRYFNLHGLVDSPYWFGQRDPSFPADYPLFPVALRPVDLTPAPGAVVFSEACFGAHIEGRGVRDSVALTYLAGGATAFVGATGVAYGGLDGPLVAADLLAQRFWQALLSGAPAGDALVFAKGRLVNEALAGQGYLDAEDEKAVLNFVLYGDPSLIHHEPTAWAEAASFEARSRGAVKRAESVAWVGTPPARPNQSLVEGRAPGLGAGAAPGRGVPKATGAGRTLAAGDLPPAAVEIVRRAVAKRLPEFAGDDVEMATAPAPVVHHPKSVATPVPPVVVTMKKASQTCCGALCRETVRVTVTPDGRIRKVVVSR